MKLSLKSKIIGITVVIILMMSALLGYFIRTAVFKSLEGEIDKRALAIGKHFAELAADSYLTESTSVLKAHLADYIATESYLAYIVIIDGEGQILAHSFPSAVPAEILQAIVSNKSPQPVHIFRRSDGIELEDFAVPIGTGYTGSVHVGIFESKIVATINGLLLKLTPYLLALILGGSAASFLLAGALTRPLNVLSQGVERVAHGDLDFVIDIRSQDEIGQLASAFNVMTEKLRATTVSRQYMEKLFDSMNEVLIVISPDGVIQSVNRAYSELFRYQPESVVGKHVADCEEQEVPACSRSVFLQAIQHGHVQGVEGACRTSEGTAVPMLFSLAVMNDEDGKVQAVVCAAQNISNLKKVQEDLHQKQAELETVNRNLEEMVALRTGELAVGNESLRAEIAERKKKTEELRAARDVAESANRAKTEFLANMSHEMRTPLNSIIGGAEFLESAVMTVEQQRCLEMIRHAGDSLLVQVNDLLDLARIESGQLELVPKEFNFLDLLEATVHMLTFDAQQKGIQLSLLPAPDVPHFVVGDQARLQQVLVNLLANAIKFTDNGGTVTVTVTCRFSAPGSVVVFFAVKDTGIGIATDKLELIFEMFAQADSSITRRYGGSGLGLAISRRLVKAMGGEINVESEPGRGSTFMFSIAFNLPEHTNKVLGIPNDSVATDGSNPEAAESGSLEPGSRLLLVDDSLENRELMRLLLARQPLAIDEAGNGLEALELFERNRYSLILMDIQMPVMDGYTATRMMRESEQRSGRRRTPVVALTAHAYEEDVRRCREAGCDDHIAKPFKKKTLLQCLARFIQGVKLV